MRLNQYGPPAGLAHGRATVPFSEIERVRDMFEYQGKTYDQIAAETGYNRNTVADWCQYKTRGTA